MEWEELGVQCPAPAQLSRPALMSQPPQATVLLQNEHQALLLAAWKVLRRNVVILLQLGGGRGEVKAG